MSISNADVEKIAKLARIRIDSNAIAEVSQRLGNILAMADRLQAVDTEGIAPMANPLELTLRLSAENNTQRLRADVVTEPVGADALRARDAFLAIAPSSEQGLYLVPKVIE
jgi:aspartyl-tRNA(Asn)/glutamyl-tRNA(Gln) amidotransferase subunit C